MSEVYATRRSRLRDHFTAAGTAAALITRPANVRYLAAAAPQGSALLLGRREDLLVCTGPPDDRPYEGRPDEHLRLHVLAPNGGDAAAVAADLAVSQDADSLAVEEHHLTVARHRAVSA
ncbi:aminopeptidase P family N-terminal domain-containing protein, partial [Streptomyces broussonetiae]